jgi:hypothetical protein
MLVVEAGSEREVRTRMEPDPWAPMGVLEIGSVQPWTIWLDSRPSASAVPSASAGPAPSAAPADAARAAQR